MLAAIVEVYCYKYKCKFAKFAFWTMKYAKQRLYRGGLFDCAGCINTQVHPDWILSDKDPPLSPKNVLRKNTNPWMKVKWFSSWTSAPRPILFIYWKHKRWSVWNYRRTVKWTSLYALWIDPLFMFNHTYTLNLGSTVKVIVLLFGSLLDAPNIDRVGSWLASMVSENQ